MRRIAVLVFGLTFGVAVGFTAVSDPAEARPRSLRGALFGIVAQPLEILRPPRGMSRRGTHRRPAAARTRQPSPAATETASTAPAAATQTAGTSAGAVSAAAATPAASGAAVAATAAAATTATATPAAAATAGGAPSEPATAPGAAAAQRSAAISQPADEPQPRGREASRAGRNAPQAVPAPAAPGRLGLVGPPTWPSAFEDVVGFALWPDKYAERLRTHGIGDVMSALFAPGAGAASSGAQVMARSRTDGAGRSDADASASPCTSGAPASGDWPTKPIEQAMALNEPQRAALDQFRTALGEALAAIRAACRDDASRSSAERLHAMQSSLWAVRDAAMLVRAPLINFYRSLTEEQKKHFTVQVSQPDPRLAQMEQRATQRRGGSPQIPREVARMCGMSAANEWPLRQIEQAIRPSKDQKASLDALQKRSTQMGQLLIASCLQPVAATPEARLDAALDRLTAMLFAITNVTLAFNDFHGQLSDDQKTRLGAFGL